MAIKIGRFFEQPIISLLIILFGLFLSLGGFYDKAGDVLVIFAIIAWLIWITLGAAKLKFIGINAKKGNTFKSIIFALIGVAVTIVGSLLTGSLLLGWDLASVSTFAVSNKAALIGAASSPFANNPALEVVIFGLGFPVAETVALAFIFSLLLIIFKARSKLDDGRVWLIALILALFAIAYHFFAKTLESGAINYNALNVIGWIFFVEIMLIVITGEIEASIWHHIFNNLLALGVLFVFTALLSVWQIVLLIVVLAFLLGRSPQVNKALRKGGFSK